MSLSPSMEVFAHVLQIALPMLKKFALAHPDLPWDRFEPSAWEIVVPKAEWLGARRELDIRVFRTEPMFRSAFGNALARASNRPAPAAPTPVVVEQPSEVPQIALTWQAYGPPLIRGGDRVHVVMHRGEILSVSGNWYVDVCEPNGRRWIERTPRALRCGALRAVISTHDGLIGVGRTTIARLVEGTWQELWRGPPPGGPAGALLDGRAPIAPALHRDELVLWGIPEQRDPSSGATAIWSPRIAWTGFDDAAPHPDYDPTEPSSGRLPRLARGFRPLLLRDTALDAVVRFGATEVAIWRGGRWESRALDAVARAIHPVHRAIVHDPGTAQTLMIDLAHGIVVRFDLAGSRAVARMTPDHLATGAAPGLAAYDPVTRRLGSVLAGPRTTSSVLDLGPVFDAAVAPRTPWID